MNGTVSRSFVERMEMEDSYALELVTGTDEHGQDFYAVLLLEANKVEDLRRTLTIKNAVLDDYGEVLAKGEGHEPPEGLIEEIRGLLTKK